MQQNRKNTRNRMKAPVVLSVVLAGVMAVQAALGLIFPEQYRDVEWIRATWFGNDWITLALGVPLLAAALLLVRRGSIRGQLLWLGMLGYGAYNYAFYLFGAALNAFFPLYIAAFLLSAVALILALSRTAVEAVAARFRSKTPVRAVGGYLTFVALGLTVIWLVMWAAYVFGGRPTPVEPEAFKLVAALDLTVMAPALASGGILLWRRHPWGYVIASIAGVQGALYLLVLTVNSMVSILRGLEEAPGQLPVWGALSVATAIATVTLLANARDDGSVTGSTTAAK